MSHRQSYPDRAHDERSLSRRTSAVLCAIASIAACALALYVYYATVTDPALFVTIGLGFFLLQAAAALCMIGALSAPRGMRNAMHWVILRFVALFVLVPVGLADVWAYDDGLIVMIVAFGALDAWLVGTSA